MTGEWYKISNEAEVPSPAVLLFPDRIRENIREMIAVAGDPGRLRPHVKTHKLPQLIRLQTEAGIGRFKCATLSEADMVAAAGGRDILIAYPLYDPSIVQLFQLIEKHPSVRFAALADNAGQLQLLENHARRNKTPLDVFLDLDVGMGRTGIPPGPEALELYLKLASSSWLRPRGLHAYDGHINMPDPTERAAACAAYFSRVDALTGDLKAAGAPPEELVCGGTPTLPVHAGFPERTLSPGTVLLWDWGYSDKFRDLHFQHAAVLFTRVISKPGRNKLCLDLGHKALASEMTPPRVYLFGIPAYEQLVHSEEHLVISFEGAERFSAGDCLYGIPIHICPTMALHDFVWTVENGKATEQWRVTARTRAVTTANDE